MYSKTHLHCSLHAIVIATTFNIIIINAKVKFEVSTQGARCGFSSLWVCWWSLVIYFYLLGDKKFLVFAKRIAFTCHARLTAHLLS